jgi:hypothetical protein
MSGVALQVVLRLLDRRLVRRAHPLRDRRRTGVVRHRDALRRGDDDVVADAADVDSLAGVGQRSCVAVGAVAASVHRPRVEPGSRGEPAGQPHLDRRSPPFRLRTGQQPVRLERLRVAQPHGYLDATHLGRAFHRG